MNLSDLSDEELALALKAGDEAAFDELVHRHQGRLYAVAYRMTGNREDALDVVQDSLVKAYRKIQSWQPRQGPGFVAWLTRLTTNQSIDHLRRQNRHRHESLEDGFTKDRAQVVASAATEDPERRARGSEIEERVQQALVVLSPSQRRVFVLRHYEGTPLAEIANVLGCTVGSVKVHLFRALRKLRVELQDLHEDEG